MSRASLAPSIEPFSIEIDDAVLADLKQRILNTRWPDRSPANPWQQGTDLDWLRELLRYWATSFQWRDQQIKLNAFAHWRTEIDGVRIHFVHERARNGGGIPLILTHGWPSAFIEYLPLVPLLTDPKAYGIEGPAFDVIIPSLPGYGFSRRPVKGWVNYADVARLWRGLMCSLGYDRYGAAGGDFGAGVATLTALRFPESTIGIHLSNLELSPYTGPGSQPLSVAELEYLAVSNAWWEAEGGYKSIQSTKPQTLAFGLNDSPAGLAAWISEKWRSWSDSNGDLDARISRDFLLTLITLYWATGTMPTSIRDYYDNRWHGIFIAPDDFVQVPTGIASFTKQYAFEGAPPQEWAERLYNVTRWRSMPRGGHFAAIEEPELLAREIVAFFSTL